MKTHRRWRLSHTIRFWWNEAKENRLPGQTRLFTTFKNLCRDSNYVVRRCGTEQLALIIETSLNFSDCIDIAKRLHNDPNRWVHLALCQNIGYILVQSGFLEAVMSIILHDPATPSN